MRDRIIFPREADFSFLVHRLLYLPESRRLIAWDMDAQVRILMLLNQDVALEEDFRKTATSGAGGTLLPASYARLATSLPSERPTSKPISTSTISSRLRCLRRLSRAGPRRRCYVWPASRSYTWSTATTFGCERKRINCPDVGGRRRR